MGLASVCMQARWCVAAALRSACASCTDLVVMAALPPVLLLRWGEQHEDPVRHLAKQQPCCITDAAAAAGWLPPLQALQELGLELQPAAAVALMSSEQLDKHIRAWHTQLRLNTLLMLRCAPGVSAQRRQRTISASLTF